jgi:hypothetical protein
MNAKVAKAAAAARIIENKNVAELGRDYYIM